MALVRRILGDAQAKLRKMVDEQVTVARSEADLEPEPADPLITPATSARQPGYLDTDKKTALALDRKINFSTALSNSIDKCDPTKQISRNGSFEKNTINNTENSKGNINIDKDGTMNKMVRLSLSSRPENKYGTVDKTTANGRVLTEDLFTEKIQNDPFETISISNSQTNGKMDSPINSQSGQNGSDSTTYAEIGIGISKYSEKNILDADSSDDDCVGEEGVSSSMIVTQSSEVGSSIGGQSPRTSLNPQQDGADQPSPRSSESRDSPCAGAGARRAAAWRADAERLQAEVTRLRRLLLAAAERGELGSALLARGAAGSEGDAAEGEKDEKVRQLEAELLIAREAVNSLKADRKRLKAEKFDLLNQMKQLYATLEDKEKELRDFIRNYEQMRAGGGALAGERAERERERAALLRHARDEAERSLQLAAALAARDSQLRHARDQLLEARRQLLAAGCLSEAESPGALLPPADRGSCSADSGVRVTGSSDGGATSAGGGNLSDSTGDGAPLALDALDVDSLSVVSGMHSHLYQLSTPRDCSPTLSPHNSSSSAFTRSIDAGSLSRSVEQLSSPGEEPSARPRGPKAGGARGRGSAWGSISRVFARSRHRAKTASGHESEPVYGACRAWSPLGGEGALREAAALPLARWRAPAVLAWLELALGMPQYAAAVADNVKSGKMRALNGQVLLELTDADLESGLGISAPMHRKKLRLAIEERRRPDLVRHPAAGQLSHAWVAAEWLPDLGLSQYAETFMANMVDARMLDNLSKKELEKYLGVTRKFHQASIVHGIHLLRIMKYDRQALAVRRHQCEPMDADPLVWTNQRFIRWAHNIDLSEYADNLKESGVHGGLVVLEPSFTGETMATALGIPPSKSIIRRHLVAEFDALVMPARNFFCHQTRVLGKPFSRSLATGLTGMGIDLSDSRRNSLRGSISRALGLKPKYERTSPTNSETASIMSLAAIQSHNYQMCYSPNHMAQRTLSQLSMAYVPPPTLQEYEPIYTPLSLYSQSSVSTKDSLQRLNELKSDNIPHRYGIQKPDNSHRVSSPLPAKTVEDSYLKQKRHRRVKSIGDINASTKSAV